MEAFRNKRITVAGLGRFGGGIEVSRWLAAQARACSLPTRRRLPSSLTPSRGSPAFQWNSDSASIAKAISPPAIWSSRRRRFLPPASISRPQRTGVPITTEIRLFIERSRPILGVTATKGKSTTSWLLGLMLKSRFNTFIGGNIGGSLLFDLPKMQKSDLVVLELSSYMLEHLRPMQWSPHVAVVGMIGVDHVEWHG